MSGSTRVSFRLPAESVALLQIFDVAGRRVATLWNGVARQGWNEVTWNSADETGARVPSGLYFYRLSVAGHPDQTRKLMVVH
jgi:flagellar hook assembly protein FlgD